MEMHFYQPSNQQKRLCERKISAFFLLGFGALILGLLIICVAGFLKTETRIPAVYHLGCTDNPIKPHHNQAIMLRFS